MDVFKIQTSIDLTGNLGRELKTVFASMENIERAGKRVKTTIDGWGGSIQRITAEVNHLAAAVGRIHSGGNRGGFSKQALGFDAKAVMADVQKIQNALKSVRGGNSGATRSFNGWASSLEKSAVAAERLNRALAGVRSHAPGGAPVRVGGGGGTGGRRGGRQRGDGEGHEGHFYRHEARGAVGAVGAAGVPTSAIHGVEEALKLAGGVDQVAAIQTAQGGLLHGKAMTKAQLAEQVRLNKEAAYALSFSQQYTTPLENMKTITDLADLGKGDYAEARALLPEIAKLNFATNLLGDEEVKARVSGHGQSRYLARGLDQMGVMAKPEAEQKRYFDAVLQGVLGTRGIFNGKQLFNAVQHSGGTAPGWSPEFVGGVLPMFTEQMNGGTSGDSIYMFAKHLLKGQMSNKTESEELVKLGLQTDNNRRGKKDFESGSILGADVLKKNIYQWFKDYFLVALAKKGITSEEGIDKAIDNLSFAKNYAKMFHEMNANKKNIDANLERFKAQGSIDPLINNTMGGQLQQLTQSTQTFLTVVADAKVPQAVTGLQALTKGISGLSETLHNDPEKATQVFGGVAAAAAGATTMGVIAIAAAAFAVGGPIALLVAGIVAVATYMAATDWDGLVAKFEKLKQGIGMGGKGPAGVTSNPGDMLPGVNGSETKPLTDQERRRAAGTQGLGVSAENTASAVRRLADSTGHTGTMADQARPLIDRLGDALLGLAKKLIVTEGVINNISFNPGGGGAGGGLIQRANLGGADAGVGVGAGGGGPGNVHVPDSVSMTDVERNKLGLIQKYESQGRNVPNYINDRTHTAQGYYQITNSNWRRLAPGLGITAPNAMAASREDQTRVALKLLRARPDMGDWTPKARNAFQRGDVYRKPVAAPPPPPPKRELTAHLNTYLDGRKIASSVTRHQFNEGNRPATGSNMADASEHYPVVG